MDRIFSFYIPHPLDEGQYVQPLHAYPDRETARVEAAWAAAMFGLPKAVLIKSDDQGRVWSHA